MTALPAALPLTFSGDDNVGDTMATREVTTIIRDADGNVVSTTTEVRDVDQRTLHSATARDRIVAGLAVIEGHIADVRTVETG